nr:ABC transporter substrate-binding protein [uncultured Methanospirillum sp.]
MKDFRLFHVCIMFMIICSFSAVYADRTITDGRGVQVTLPDQINRVVTSSDGFDEAIMYNLGEIDKIVGTSPFLWNISVKWGYPSVKGENVTITPGHTVIETIYPKIKEIPSVIGRGTAPNYEKIAELKPDVFIIRAGDCNYWDDLKSLNKVIDTLESMGIPTVVTFGPNAAITKNNSTETDLDSISNEIKIIGDVFGKEEQAGKLAAYLEQSVDSIKQKTSDVADEKKPKVLLLGLSNKGGSDTGSAGTWGVDTLDSYLTEDIVNAKNAFQDTGNAKVLNAEQIIASNPDVIVLETWRGYHPVGELKDAPYYQIIKDMPAIKNDRIMSMPWMPANCDKRESYPIEAMVLAKAAYPDKFADINISDWLIDFYKNVYNVDENMARKIADAQKMDWAFAS